MGQRSRAWLPSWAGKHVSPTVRYATDLSTSIPFLSLIASPHIISKICLRTTTPPTSTKTTHDQRPRLAIATSLHRTAHTSPFVFSHVVYTFLDLFTCLP